MLMPFSAQATIDIANTQQHTQRSSSASKEYTSELTPLFPVTTKITQIIGAMQAVKDFGLKVPEDVSFVGFDGINLANEVAPSLTTVSVDRFTMGSVAVSYIIDRIEKKEKTETDYHKILINPVLKEGGSVSITGSDGKGVFTNIQYHGLNSSSGNTVVATKIDPPFAIFKFEGMRDSNNNHFNSATIEHVKEWKYNTNANAWIHNSEFSSSGNVNVTNEYYSSLIMLNLDCSSSLGDKFDVLKGYAKQFVDGLKTN